MVEDEIGVDAADLDSAALDNPDFIEQDDAIRDQLSKPYGEIAEMLPSGYLDDVMPKQFQKDAIARAFTNPDMLAQFERERANDIEEIKPEIKYKAELCKEGIIVKSDWLPYKGEDIFDFDPLFVAWVLSGERGFSNIIDFPKFEMYIKQAYDWFDEGIYISDFSTIESKLEFSTKEIARFKTNTLYYIRKYGTLNDSDMDGGSKQFVPYRSQAFVIYLLDCGYGLLIDKMRQIGFSSIIAYYFYVKTAYSVNIKCKFIAKDEKKTEEIFNDKILQPFDNAPASFAPNSTKRGNTWINIGYETEKIRKGKGTSIIRCETPNRDSINGGSPDIVGIDECGGIRFLSKMINEGRPAAIKYIESLGFKVLSRQIIGWGTGGEMETDDFEEVYTGLWEQWNQGERRNNLIPIFIDFFSHPHNTKSFYESEKKRYYSSKNENNADAEAQFHAHYPLIWQDSFVKKSKTLIAAHVINAHLDRIAMKRRESPLLLPQGGKFGYEPDLSKPLNNGTGFEYEIKSVFWEPEEFTIGTDGKLRTAKVYKIPGEPFYNWEHRYFQGTDSIDNFKGASNFASAIWDSEYMCPACIVNFREYDYFECYQQAHLMNLYYKKPPHLIEINKGAGLVKFLELMGAFGTIVFNDELPPLLQKKGSGAFGDMGINSNSSTKRHIMDYLIQITLNSVNYIWFEDFFKQLKTFIHVPSRSGQQMTWRPENPEIHKDDVIDAVTFSYICAMIYRQMGVMPVDLTARNSQPLQQRYGYVRDSLGNLVRQAIL